MFYLQELNSKFYFKKKISDYLSVFLHDYVSKTKDKI
jgi:hypothetical protein